MVFATMNASPPRTCRMRNAPPGKGKPHAKCSPWKGKAQLHAKCSPWKGKAQPHAKCPPWKGKAQPHAKCSLPERDSLPIDFMLE